MTKDQAQAALKDIENLAAFSATSRIPLRTLHRLKAGDGDPGRTTLVALELALSKPKRKPAAHPKP